MSLPVCPNCGSGAITWSDPVPSGHNGCLACGHVAPVASFHQEKPVAAYRRGSKTPLQLTQSRVAGPRSARHPQQTPKTEPIEGDFWWQNL